MNILRNTLIVLSVILLFHYATSARQAVVTKKSKLCSDVDCKEVLFKSRVKRVMGVNNDPNFLKLTEDAIVDVFAVKFSDRPDIMEGQLADGSRGFFYAGALDKHPYAEFLRSAIEMKKEMHVISQDANDIGEKKILGVVHSETDLVRDYNARAREYANENGLPPPEEIPVPEPTGGHGHSHGGHGHSHGGHGHSHGAHGHSHSHSATPTPAPAAQPAETVPVGTPPPVATPPATTPPVDTPSTTPPSVASPPVVTPSPVVDPLPVNTPVETPKIEPEVKKEEPKQDLNLNNVLGAPPVIKILDEEAEKAMDAEIEKLLAIETVEHKKNIAQQSVTNEVKVEPVVEQQGEKQPEVTQPPLELHALPAEPLQVTTEAPVQIPEPVVTPIPQAADSLPVDTVTPAPIVHDTPVVNDPTPVQQEPIAMYIPPPSTDLPPLSNAADPIPIIEDPVVTPAPIDEERKPIGDAVTPIPEMTTPPPTVNQDDLLKTESVVAKNEIDEEFLKWEEERKKREAKPYEDSYGQKFENLGIEKNYSGDMPPPPPLSSDLLNFIRRTFGLGNITDSSIIFYINITCIASAFIIYVIINALSSNTDQGLFDKMAYFDLTTKHKALEVQLKTKDAEIQRLQALGHQKHQQQHAAVANDQELMSLRNQLHTVQNELIIASSEKEQTVIQFNQLREQFSEKQQEVEHLKNNVYEMENRLHSSSEGAQDVSRELHNAQSELADLKHSMIAREQEITEIRRLKDESSHELEIEVSRFRQLELSYEQAEARIHEIEEELKTTKLENVELAAQIERLQANEGSAAESGGSGWSDFGDNEEFEDKKTERKEETTPEASLSQLADIRERYKSLGENLEELNALKAKLIEAEKEVAKYKSLFEKEERLKMEKDNKLKHSEILVGEAKKKIEDLEKDKKDSGDRLNEMFKMFTENLQKKTDADQTITSLTQEGFAKEKKILEIEAVLRKKEDKIREVESNLKRMEHEYAKLETKSFHDVMNLKKQVDDFKTSQILGNSSMPFGPPDTYHQNDFGSSNILPDRRLTSTSPLDFPPIWDEPDQHQMLPQEGYMSSGSTTMPTRRRSNRRSDMRLLPGFGGENSPSDREDKSKSKKEGTQRRRSRSQGRQPQMLHDPYSMQYMPGSSDSSFMSQNNHGFAPLTKRHSKSGHLQYSSGGSNGGRSPPPEMPLLSAVPPPDIRKPTTKMAGTSHHSKQ